MTVVDHARALSQGYGISVLPIREEKRPGIRWGEFQRRRMTAAEVRRHFRGVERLALICGAVSGGLEVLDFDRDGFFERWAEGLRHSGFGELLDRVVVQGTPSGGRHVLYRCAEVGRNQKLACVFGAEGRREVAVETRGEGGYVLAFPTEGYSMCRGKLSEIPYISASERAALLLAARVLDETAEEASPEVRPGDLFEARVSWASVLEPYGWVCLGSVAGRERWRRPGKEGNACSATTGNGFGGRDLLKVFSSNAAPFEMDGVYGKFRAYALLNFGGDLSAAAAQVGRELGVRELGGVGPGGRVGPVGRVGPGDIDGAGRVGALACGVRLNPLPSPIAVNLRTLDVDASVPLSRFAGSPTSPAEGRGMAVADGVPGQGNASAGAPRLPGSKHLSASAFPSPPVRRLTDSPRGGGECGFGGSDGWVEEASGVVGPGAVAAHVGAGGGSGSVFPLGMRPNPLPSPPPASGGGGAWDLCSNPAVDFPLHRRGADATAGFRIYGLDELWEMPEKPMLVRGLIGVQDRWMVYGVPGCGKSFSVLDLLVTCAVGGVWAGQFECVRPLNVLYCTAEGKYGIPRRIRACVAWHELSLDDVNARFKVMLDVPQTFDVAGERSILRLAEQLAEGGWLPDVVVLDTLNKAAIGSNENDNSDAAVVCDALARVGDRLGCSTGVIHHSAWDKEHPRGASAYFGDADFVLRQTLDAETKEGKIHLAKGKDIPPFSDIPFSLVGRDGTAVVDFSRNGFEAGDPALTVAVLTMRGNPERTWWTAGELHGLMPKYTVDAIRMALRREASRREGLLQWDRSATPATYRLRGKG